MGGDHENAVRISGTAEERPVLRYTPKGSPATHFILSNRRTLRPLSGPAFVETLRVCVAAWHQLAIDIEGSVRRGSLVTVEGYLSRADPRTASNVRAQVVVVAQRVWVEPDNREPQQATAGPGEQTPRMRGDAPPPAQPAVTQHGRPQLPPAQADLRLEGFAN